MGPAPGLLLAQDGVMYVVTELAQSGIEGISFIWVTGLDVLKDPWLRGLNYPPGN